MSLKKTKLDYKWVILVLCFMMEFLCLGFCSSNPGLYTKSVTEALNIKRSVYSLSNSIRYAVQVLVALNFGTIVDRFGVKKMACAGMLSMTVSVAIRACATQVYHIYIGSVLWGAGIVFAGGTMAGTIVRRWFQQDIGRYTGIVMSANGIGGAIAAQIISPIINNGETFGYRKAYWLSAAIALVITVVILIFLRENPKERPIPTGATGKKKRNMTLWEGLPYEKIKRKPYFYITAAMVFLTGISLQSIGSISIIYMEDIGLSSGFVATTATVSSLTLFAAKILVGTTYDKWGLRVALTMCLAFAMVAFVIKAILTASAVGMVLAMVACVLSSLALPMETVIVPLLSNDLFGSAAYTKVLGIFMAMNSLGLCLGSPLGDFYYDLFGTYKPCFWFFTLLLSGVLVGYQFVIRAARKDRARLETAQTT